VADKKQVLIVDNPSKFRSIMEGVLLKIEAVSREVHHSGTIENALKGMANTQFDLILLNLSISDQHDFKGYSQIRSIDANVPIIIILRAAIPRADTLARSLGVSGLICENDDVNTITRIINSALLSYQTMPISQKVGMNAANPKGLTPAQRRVMTCFSNGLLNKQIAFEMGISEATVKAHMSAIFRKLGATNRTQALLIYHNTLLH